MACSVCRSSVGEQSEGIHWHNQRVTNVWCPLGSTGGGTSTLPTLGSLAEILQAIPR